jgi:glutaredoxin-like YruB-family protein
MALTVHRRKSKKPFAMLLQLRRQNAVKSFPKPRQPPASVKARQTATIPPVANDSIRTNKKDSKFMVKVYSTPTCPYCVTLKTYLKERDIDFKDIDVAVDEKAREEMVEKTGQLGVPVINIDGEFVVGFDKEKINQLLNIKE